MSQVHCQAPQNSDIGTIESSSLTILLHFDRAPDLKKINSKLGLAGCPPRVGNQKGRTPRTLKGTEVLHKPLYLGNRNPGRWLYIQWNIHSELTYGSLLPFRKTNMRKRKQALLLISAINFEKSPWHTQRMFNWNCVLKAPSPRSLPPSPYLLILISRRSF